MNKRIFCASGFILALCFGVFGQATVPTSTMVSILRAEDERRFDKDLQDLMKSPSSAVRKQAALAAGRIGDERAVPFLIELFEKDLDYRIRSIAAFALGEIESVAAADTVLSYLKRASIIRSSNFPPDITARAIEAAGKIASANAKDPKALALGEAVLDALDAEFLQPARSRDVVLMALTAALRVRPAEADLVVAKFLSDKDARIRADAGNALARLRAKNENTNAKMRALLLADDDAVVRANAARVLGGAEDKMAFEMLVEAATTDDDSRVRVAAIRALASLKDKKAAEPLLVHAEKLLAAYKTAKTKNANPAEKNELLEIATTLGRLLQNSNEVKAVKFLNEFDKLEKYQTPEISIALVRIAPITRFTSEKKEALKSDWRVLSSVSLGVGEIANLENTDENKKFKDEITKELYRMLDDAIEPKSDRSLAKAEMAPGIPDLLRSYASFKSNNVAEGLRGFLTAKDIVIRATAAELLGEQPASKENIEALKTSFSYALENDLELNDAQLAILSALVKLDKREAVESLRIALDAPDYLVRRHAAQLIKENGLAQDFPNAAEKVGTVRAVAAGKNVSTQGVILNRPEDYARALSRKNGSVRAVVTTEKGAFTIEFLPEDAPLTVDNFVKLARSNYFNGVTIHRVVPNFVMQDGDPRGDGNGGPGYSIRDEINLVPFERGVVGMALSGKDTGGSQWFVTHSPQPHLDGGYTVFGRVDETGMKVVDKIARGDRILSIKITEGAPIRSKPARRKK